MKIGIICAMQEELDSIINALHLKYERIEEKCFTVFKSSYLHHELICILSGIGKVNAAIHTQYILDKFVIDCIINVGVAGSLSKELSFGDVVIASDLVEHDVDVAAFDLPLGQIPRMDTFSFSSEKSLLDKVMLIQAQKYKIHLGRIVSGDQFIDNKEKAEFISKHFGAVACEMEGAAIAHVCHVNKIPFLVIRALSDMAGCDDVARHSFNELKDMASLRSAQLIKQLLDVIG